MAYVCPLCNHNFSQNSRLKYHMEHHVCENKKKSEADKICPFCQHVFISKRKCQSHIEHKMCPINNDRIKQLEEENNRLCIEIKSLKHSLNEHPQIINNFNSQSNQINIVFPQAFGHEKIDEILQKMPALLHETLTKHGCSPISFLTSKIHCDSNVFPEYNNVYINSVRDPYAMVSNGNKFTHRPKNLIIGDIIEQSISWLQSYVDDNGDKLGDKVIKKYEQYRDLVEQSHSDSTESNQARDNLELEIGGLLLDMKNVIVNHFPQTKQMIDQLIYE